MYQYRQDRERLIERVIELQAQGEIWEKGKRIQNTSGAWFLDITIDDEGSVTGLKAESIIQYKKTLDDWKGYK